MFYLSGGISHVEYWCFVIVDIINWMLLSLLVVGYSTFSLSMFTLVSICKSGKEMDDCILKLIFFQLNVTADFILSGMFVITLAFTLGVDVLFNLQQLNRYQTFCKLYSFIN